MTEINEKKLREELIVLLESFLKSPENDEIHRKAAILSNKYGGLCCDNAPYKKYISEDILIGIGSLSHIYLYGENSGITNKEILSVVKETLIKLKSEMISKFLKEYIVVAEAYLNNSKTTEEVSSFIIKTIIADNEYSKMLLNYNKKIILLGEAIDITDPSLNNKKKKKLMNRLIILAKEILNN
jgi:hypothetical protein